MLDFGVNKRATSFLGSDMTVMAASSLLDEVWKSCTYLQHESHHCGFGFFASSQFLEDTFRELGWVGVEGSEEIFKHEGLWIPIRSIDACSLFRGLSLVWKCKDDPLSFRCKFQAATEERIHNSDSSWMFGDFRSGFGQFMPEKFL